MTYTTLTQTLSSGDIPSSGHGGFTAPHEGSDGNLYIVTRPSATTIAVQKSTNLGANWTSTTIFTAATGSVGDYSAVFTGNRLDVIRLREASTQAHHILVADITAGSYSPTVTEVQAILTAGQFLARLAAVAVSGTRDFVALPGARFSDMGTSYDRIAVFARVSGGAWSSPFLVGTNDTAGGAVNYGQHQLVAGASERVHVIHIRNNQSLRIVTLSWSGSAWSSSFRDSVTLSSARPSRGVLFGGNIYFWANGNVYRFADTATNGVPAVAVAMAGSHGSVAVVGSLLVACVTDGSTVTYRTSTDGATWASAQTLRGSLGGARTRIYLASDTGGNLRALGSASDGTFAYYTGPAAGPPATAPTVTFGAVAGTSVPLNWTSVTGATQYEIRRGGTLIHTTAGATLTYTDTGRTPDTSYSYTVTAINGSGSGPASTAAVTRTGPFLDVLGVSASHIELSFVSALGGPYTLQRDGVTIYTGSDTVITDTGRAHSTLYNYRVNRGGNWSDVVAAQTAFKKVLNLQGSLSGDTLTLTWDPVTGD